MSWFEPPGHRGPGLFERLLGWLLGWIVILVAVSVALEILVAFLVPLLPWIGFTLLIGAVVASTVAWRRRQGSW